jgi:hypothetical protein
MTQAYPEDFRKSVHNWAAASVPILYDGVVSDGRATLSDPGGLGRIGLSSRSLRLASEIGEGISVAKVFKGRTG